MIPVPKPQRAGPALVWDGRHLYQEWPSGRRHYVGSVVHESFARRWSLWHRGRHLGSFLSEEGTRGGLEEHARGETQ